MEVTEVYRTNFTADTIYALLRFKTEAVRHYTYVHVIHCTSFICLDYVYVEFGRS